MMGAPLSSFVGPFNERREVTATHFLQLFSRAMLREKNRRISTYFTNFSNIVSKQVGTAVYTVQLGNAARKDGLESL